MPKWKIQRVSPDTCDTPGCVYLEVWDVEEAFTKQAQGQNYTGHRIAAFERACAAHADPDIPVGVLLWSDGNWKDLAQYLDYQRAYFRRLNHVEWLQKNPGEAMPPQIAGYTSDPATPGSVSAPPQAKVDAQARAYGWNKRDNARKNQTLDAMGNEKSGFDRNRATWRWNGAGETRTLVVNGGGQMTAQQRQRAQAALDIQFGGAVTVEA